MALETPRVSLSDWQPDAASLETWQLEWTMKPCVLLGGKDRTNGLAEALRAHMHACMVKSSDRLVFNLKLACPALLLPKADTSSL